MTAKKYRVHDFVKFQYSAIGEYVDENHTDKPLRNDEIVDLLNEQHEIIEQFTNIARECNIPFDKLCDAFEKSIDWDCETDCKINAIQILRENEQLKQNIKNLKTTLVARETLIDVCEKKFGEMGYIITVDDNGYVIE